MNEYECRNETVKLLGEGVKQWKRIADQGYEKSIAKRIADLKDDIHCPPEARCAVCKSRRDELKKLDTPACCDGLKKAVEEFLAEEICGGTSKPTWERSAREALEHALAHTCQRDESALADVVDGAIACVETDMRQLEKHKTINTFLRNMRQHMNVIKSALEKYRGDA